MPRSKGQWEMFHKQVWSRPSFKALSSDARLLYLWSWTNEKAALSGLYEASPRDLARALADSNGEPGEELERRLAAALRELAAKPLVLYDDDAWVIWVVGRVEHALRSPTVGKRMRMEYEECPASPLRGEFLATYGEMLEIRSERGA